MDTINSLPLTGKILLFITTLIFALTIALSLALRNRTVGVIELLVRSVRTGEDYFTEPAGIIQELRSSYRSKLAKLEQIDPSVLVMAHLERWPIKSVGSVRISFRQASSFLSSAPSYLVTLGLIGTFLGLIENLAELSALLAAAGGQNLGGLLGSMSTAFAVSLFGITFSLIVWLLEHLLGIDTIEERLISLSCAYLDGVVQHDVKRYSLVGEAVARIETYLSEFLANFTLSVGQAIDSAMRSKLDEVFNTIQNLCEISSEVIGKMDEGATRVEAGSLIFKEASELIAKPGLAKSVVQASKQLIDANQILRESLQDLGTESAKINDNLENLFQSWEASAQAISNTNSNTENLAIQIAISNEAMSEYAKRLGTALDSIRDTADALENTNSTNKELSYIFREVRNEASSATQSLTSAIEIKNKSLMASDATMQELKLAASTLNSATVKLEAFIKQTTKRPRLFGNKTA